MVPRSLRDDEVEVLCREAELTLSISAGENRKISGCLQGQPCPSTHFFNRPEDLRLPLRWKVREQCRRVIGVTKTRAVAIEFQIPHCGLLIAQPADIFSVNLKSKI